MTNFNKLIFNPNWVKICQETMSNFKAEKVALLRFSGNCFNILSFPEYECDTSDLISLRAQDGIRGGFCYFMPLAQFEELFKDVLGFSFLAECSSLESGERNGVIRDGIGLRKEFFGGKVKTFLLQDPLDLVAMGKLESILWR